MGAEKLRPQVNISIIQIDIVSDNNLLTHRRDNGRLVNFCRIDSFVIAETSISGFDLRWIQQIGGFRICGIVLSIIGIIHSVGKLGVIPVGRHG